jgi:putative restriction endonuclease
MPLQVVVAVTDFDWFQALRATPSLAEVNFWAPSATSFKALREGELFLFKLKAPRNFIVGGGIFSYATDMPVSLAWTAFGTANGAATQAEMRARIARLRAQGPDDRSDFRIGCRMLAQPFFLPEQEWLPTPASFLPNTVTFKRYSTDEADGLKLWEWANDHLASSNVIGVAEQAARYGEPVLVKPRLGQGTFRALVTDVYHRACAVTGERTLPALEAAHIRPYAEGGEHEASNGLLLRRDLHSLFDAGYVTVTPSLHFEVSPRIRTEFENGRHYYELHGQPIRTPDAALYKPDLAALGWHNERVFR